MPVYNAEPTLAKVVKDVRRNLPGTWIIGIDDGSTDGSRKLLKTVVDETIEFDKNRGKGAAPRAGFDAALKKGAAAVLTIDSDGQHDAAFAPAIRKAKFPLSEVSAKPAPGACWLTTPATADAGDASAETNNDDPAETT